VVSSGQHTIKPWHTCIAALGAPIDQDDCTWTISGEPRLSGVADDREQPFAWVLPGRTVERLQRGHVSVLHDVFGVRDAARQPARQRLRVGPDAAAPGPEVPPRGFARHMSPIACQGIAVILPFICGCLAAKIDNLAGHVENESEAFVPVERVRVEVDRVDDKPPFSKSLRTNIRLRSGIYFGYGPDTAPC